MWSMGIAPMVEDKSTKGQWRALRAMGQGMRTRSTKLRTGRRASFAVRCASVAEH